MKVVKLINSILSSNTYLIFKEEGKEVWVIDPGDSRMIIEWLNDNDKILKGILITHYHFDHIFGINELRQKFKDSLVYASEKSKEGLFSAKLNGSYYAEMPFIIENSDVIFVRQENSIELWNGMFAKVYETPGHNDDCISFFVDNNLFTGDALIPGMKVHLKSRKSNKEQAHKTIDWIINSFEGETVIHPGHKDGCILKKLKISFYEHL